MFSKVEDQSITTTKGLLYKGEKGRYFRAENTRNQLQDLRCFWEVEGHENIVRYFIHCTF